MNEGDRECVWFELKCMRFQLTSLTHGEVCLDTQMKVLLVVFKVETGTVNKF